MSIKTVNDFPPPSVCLSNEALLDSTHLSMEYGVNNETVQLVYTDDVFVGGIKLIEGFNSSVGPFEYNRNVMECFPKSVTLATHWDDIFVSALKTSKSTLPFSVRYAALCQMTPALLADIRTWWDATVKPLIEKNARDKADIARSIEKRPLDKPDSSASPAKKQKTDVPLKNTAAKDALPAKEALVTKEASSKSTHVEKIAAVNDLNVKENELQPSVIPAVIEKETPLPSVNDATSDEAAREREAAAILAYLRMPEKNHQTMSTVEIALVEKLNTLRPNSVSEYDLLQLGYDPCTKAMKTSVSFFSTFLRLSQQQLNK